MTPTQQFFNKRTLVSSLVFSLVVSVVFMWRFTNLRGIPFFSMEAGKIYATFVVVDYLIILLVFYIMFMINRRKQQ